MIRLEDFRRDRGDWWTHPELGRVFVTPSRYRGVSWSQLMKWASGVEKKLRAKKNS